MRTSLLPLLCPRTLRSSWRLSYFPIFPSCTQIWSCGNNDFQQGTPWTSTVVSQCGWSCTPARPQPSMTETGSCWYAIQRVANEWLEGRGWGGQILQVKTLKKLIRTRGKLHKTKVGGQLCFRKRGLWPYCQTSGSALLEQVWAISPTLSDTCMCQ